MTLELRHFTRALWKWARAILSRSTSASQQFAIADFASVEHNKIEAFLQQRVVSNASPSSIDYILLGSSTTVGVFTAEKEFETIFLSLQILFKNSLLPFDHLSRSQPDVLYLWGLAENSRSIAIVECVDACNKPLLVLEDGFLRSILPWSATHGNADYRRTVSFTVDTVSTYTDAVNATLLERILNNPPLLSDAQLQRADSILHCIQQLKLSKYNHQPIYPIELGRLGKQKVLVVDQNFGDTSVRRGLAGPETFAEMLRCAVAENPDADIVIKAHPDTVGETTTQGYFSPSVAGGRVIYFSANINPLCLLDQVHKVYVCTSQLGMEAALYGKEVHVFGLPFYSNWGFTRDRIRIGRRRRACTLTEFFCISYMLYSKYVNPATKQRCEIEEAIGYLLERRQQFFNESGVICDPPALLTARLH